MRYYTQKSEPFVSSYVGNKYNPDLYLKAGAILEDRLNQAEAANAKFQETGELTPGYYTALSGEAEEINQKIRATKQRAAQAASEGKTRELTDALYQGQAIYTSPQAKRVQSDFEKTNKYITPEIVKREGNEGEAFLMRGSKDPNAIRNTANIPDEWYGLYDNKLSPQSLTYLKNFQADVDNELRTAQVPQKNPLTGEMEMVSVTNSSQYKDYRRQAFGERINDKIDAMGPNLSNPGEDLSGIFFEKGKGYLGTDATPGSGKDPNHPEWSELQVKGKEKILDYGKLLYHEEGKTIDKTSGFDNGNSGSKSKVPVDSNSLMAGNTEQLNVNLSNRPINTPEDLDKLLTEDYNPNNVISNFIKNTYAIDVNQTKLQEIAEANDYDAKKTLEQLNTFLWEPLPITPNAIEGLQMQLDLNEIAKNDLEQVKQEANNNAILSSGVPVNPDGSIQIDPTVQEKIKKIEAAELKKGYLPEGDMKLPAYMETRNSQIPAGEWNNYVQLKNKVSKEAEDKAFSQLGFNTPKSEKKQKLDLINKERDTQIVEAYNSLMDKYVKYSPEELSKANDAKIAEAKKYGKVGQYYADYEEGIKQAFLPLQMGFEMTTPDKFGMFTMANGKDESVGNVILSQVEGNEVLQDFYTANSGNNSFEKVVPTEIFKDGVQQINFDKTTPQIVVAPTENKYFLRYSVTPTSGDDKEKNKKDATQAVKYYYADVTDKVNNLANQNVPGKQEKMLAPGDKLKFDFQASVWDEVKLLPKGASKPLTDLPVYLSLPPEVEAEMAKFSVKRLANDSYLLTHPLIPEGTQVNKKTLVEDLTTALNGFSQKYNSGTLGGVPNMGKLSLKVLQEP